MPGWRYLRKHLLPHTLVNRVFVLYGAMLMVFIGGGLALFLGHQFHRQVEESQQSAVMLIEVVAVAVQDSVVIGDYDTVVKTLQKVVQASMFDSAAFMDLSGGIIRASSPTTRAGYAPQGVVEWVESRLYDVNRTISVGGHDYGVLRLKFDAVGVADDLWQVSVKALLLAAGGLAVGLALIRFLLTRWLGGLARLQEIEHAGADGNALVPVDPGAPREIRRVLRLFNRTVTLMREREESRRALDNQKFALDQHAIVSMTDRDGNIIYANDRLREISGYSPEELFGHNHRLLASGAHSREFFAEMWGTIAAGKVWRGEICNRAKSGDLYWVDATIVPLPGADGRPGQYIAIRTDITGRKATEESLKKARDDAQRSDRAKSAFLANMSHEIRTPLNAVLGMLELLHSTGQSGRQLDYTTKAESAARALLGVLNDVLDFSKVEAGMMKLDPHPFHLDRMLRDLAVIMAANVGDRDVEVLFDVDPRLPAALVGDDLRLQQVLINLGGNAVKFTERGQVALRVRETGRSEGHAEVEFSVSDTGIGIAPDVQARIFDGFTQAEASTTRRFGGTGLGLAICQRLLALMGSRIAIDSTPGKGSTFSFRLRLPLAPDDGTVAADTSLRGTARRVCAVDDDAGARDRAPVRTRTPRLQGMRLLLVEDNATNQQVASELLALEGAQVEVAGNGQLGVLALAMAGVEFDAVLMDLQMPVMDGFTATRAIRGQLGKKTLPIIAMTANAMDSDREACLAAGMNDHVGKPFDMGALVATLLRHARPAAVAAVDSQEGAGQGLVPAALLASAAAQGIDLEAGLARMNGEVGIYLHLLRTFAREVAPLAQQLRADVDGGDREAAIRLMHSYKGASATIGARRLNALTASLESSLRDTPDEDVDERVASMAQVVDETLAAVAMLDRELAECAESR